VLFGGKGGVGKTTCATASALHLARLSPEKTYLLVSTDPAHSLADCLGGAITPPNLKILELNAKKCMADFIETHQQKLREIALRGTFFDEEDINRFINLSLPGLDELMAFLEISRWAENRSYGCIIVDTAPTGHTMRLLSMPDLILKWVDALDVLLAKHRYMKMLFRGSYRRDELDDFIEELGSSTKKTATLLQDAVRCRFVPVMLAETLSMRETTALLKELKKSKIAAPEIVVNRLFPKNACPVCTYTHNLQMDHLRELLSNPDYSQYVLWGVPLYPVEVLGAAPLVSFWEKAMRIGQTDKISPPVELALLPHVEAPLPCPKPEMTLLLFAGKGGVGKTTLACATAVRLASDLQGKGVLLFSTDPAHSLSDCLGVPVGSRPVKLSPGLTAMEIDAGNEFESLKSQYEEDITRLLGSMSQNLDLKFDRDAMEKVMDLAPPGIDEIMALSLAMTYLSKGSYDILVFDSAPTGHLIRLLELPHIIDQWLKLFFSLFLKYREVFRLPKISRRMVQMSKEIKQLRSLLKDPDRSALYAVSIPTMMALRETEDLIAACDRMEVNVPVLFLNLVTPAGECPLCSELFLRESRVREQYRAAFPGIHQTLVYRQSEPLGIGRLKDLGRLLYEPSEAEAWSEKHKNRKTGSNPAEFRNNEAAHATIFN